MLGKSKHIDLNAHVPYIPYIAYITYIAYIPYENESTPESLSLAPFMRV